VSRAFGIIAAAGIRGSLVAVCLVASASAVFASDGLIEINQATALAGGVNGDLVADPAGFPVTITRSGSYRLTSNLAVFPVTADGIDIAAGVDDVTIDLGGFTIRGLSGVNVNPPLWQCTGGGDGTTGHGILGPGNSIAVRNGRIRSMGGDGSALLGSQASVERVVLEQNCGRGILAAGVGARVDANQVRASRFAGISTGIGSVVTGNTLSLNAAAGIESLDASVVSSNVAYANGGAGLSLKTGSVASGNIAYDNGSSGIDMKHGGLISGNSVYANRGPGISAGSGSTVSSNAVYGNTGYGVSADQSLVHGNTIRANDGTGLFMHFGAYRENDLEDDGVSGGFNLGANFCDPGLCP